MKVIPWNGAPISKPGIYSGVDMESYHGQLTIGPSLSKSVAFTIFDKSPAHAYKSLYLNPDREEASETEALRAGRGAHHLILREPDFEKHFAVEDATYTDEKGVEKPWHNGAGVCKRWALAQKAAKKTILSAKHIEQIRGMAVGLAANPLVRAGALEGLIEHTLVFQHQKTDIWIKVRPDAIPVASGDVADLKRIADISDEGIERGIADYGHNMQGGMTGMAWREIFERPMESFNLVFSEATSPHWARVRALTDEDLALGEEQAEVAIEIFARCVKTGYWPGPGAGKDDAKFAPMASYRRKAIEFKLLQLKAEYEIG